MYATAPLTESERAQFERDGYLIVPGALDAVTLARVRAVAHEHDAQFRAENGVGPFHVLNEHDLVASDERWLDLIDWPATFPKVWALLGWNIQLFHTQLLVTPPAPAGATAGAYGWHQDNNRMNRDLATTPQPRISVKIGYFLTDLSEPGMGNLCVVPGSHLAGAPTFTAPEQPAEAVE